MIRSLEKLLPSVPASPPQATSKAAECNVCDSNALIPAQKLSNSASCLVWDGYDPPESQSVFKVDEDEDDDDWEFAEDEEKEDVEASAEAARYLTGAITVPNLLQLSLPLPVEAPTGDTDSSGSSLEVRTEFGGYLDEEIGQSSACDWFEPPPLSGSLAMEGTPHQIGDEGVMLEAFQQFQHNPQIQKMVVALATDERVWQAVVANKKIQEYRVVNAEGDFESQDFNSVAAQGSMASSFILLSHNAVRELMESLWDPMRGIFDVLDKRLQNVISETRQLMFDMMVRAFMMTTVFMLTLIAFLCLLPLHASLDTLH